MISPDLLAEIMWHADLDRGLLDTDAEKLALIAREYLASVLRGSVACNDDCCAEAHAARIARGES